MHKPSRYQQDFYDFCLNGSGNAIIEAVAGAGKTSSMIHAANLLHDKKCLFLAFNSSIAKELKEKVPANCEASTLNSIGHRAWMRHAGRVNLEQNKTRQILSEIMSEEDFRFYSIVCQRLISLAKANGVVPEGIPGVKVITEDTNEFWYEQVDFYSIDIPGFIEEDKAGNFVPSKKADLILWYCREALKKSIKMQNIIDFDDQLYMTSIHQIPLGKFDFVFVDESQDTNLIQQEMLKLAMTMGTRLIAVGDPKQSIYSFRSALSNSMQRLQESFNCKILPLSICYRCPTSHLDLARGIVPHIENSPSAIEGEVQDFDEKWDEKIFQANDLIICRYNAPLVKTAYKLLAAKLPVKIMGRDIGSGMINIIKKLKAKNQSDLTEKLDQWREKEIKKILKKDPKGNTDPVEDKYETIVAFQEMFSDRTIDGLISGIENIYSDQGSTITLASVHRAKGLESDRVFVINFGDMPSKRAKKEWEIEQEMNIKYIALTRAKKYLGFIDVPKKKKD